MREEATEDCTNHESHVFLSPFFCVNKRLMRLGGDDIQLLQVELCEQLERAKAKPLPHWNTF